MGGGPIGTVITITGNAGGAVGPDIAGNINIIGTNPITVTGNPGTNTETITVATATTAQIGVTTLATNAETIAGAVSAHAVVPSSLAAKLGAQTLNAIAYGGGAANAINWLGPLTNGQLIIGSTGAAPVAASLTPGTGISITPGAGTITIAVTGAMADSFPTDSGTATPSIGVLNILSQLSSLGCGSSVFFSAPGPSNIVQLNITDADNNTMIGKLAGNLTHTPGVALDNTGIGFLACQNLTTGAENTGCGIESIRATTIGNYNTAIGAESLDACPAGSYNVAVGLRAGYLYITNESNNIVIGNTGSPGDNNVIRLGNTNPAQIGGIQTSCYVAGIASVNVGSVAAVVSIATATGQLGTTTITAGTGISITPGAGTITIASTAVAPFTWTVETADQNMVVNHGYIANKAGLLTLTLPAVSAVGDIVEVTGINTALGWRISQNAGNTIYVGTITTTPGVGGYLASSAIHDSIKLVCATANAHWVAVTGLIGNLTFV